MESKPIYFRPSEKDLEVLSLIAKQHPVFSDSSTELLRIALQAYWYEHAPDAGRSKSQRIERLEKKMDLVLTHLGLEFAEATQ